MRRFFLSTFALAAILLTAKSFAGISYEQEQRAAQYAKDTYASSPNYFLATKGIRKLLSETTATLEDNASVLDFGCGPGTLSSFYSDMGFKVTGVDISPAMIEQGQKQFENINFHLINKGELPFEEGIFDAAFTSFVLLEMDNRAEIISVLEEIKRVLKPGAPLVVVTTSEHVYNYKSYNFIGTITDFVENDTLVSGGKVKLQLKTLDYAFEDYFWSDDDYRMFFKEAGFQTISLESPLGAKEDEESLSISWLDEVNISPISVYLVQ